MPNYCINKNGDREVHNINSCQHLPETHNRDDFFANNDDEAMVIARLRYFDRADGCYWCMNKYHSK